MATFLMPDIWVAQPGGGIAPHPGGEGLLAHETDDEEEKEPIATPDYMVDVLGFDPLEVKDIT